MRHRQRSVIDRAAELQAHAVLVETEQGSAYAGQVARWASRVASGHNCTDVDARFRTYGRALAQIEAEAVRA
jgi:hypothetical protein